MRKYPSEPGLCSTMVEVLRCRALNEPDRIGYTFLVDGEAEEVHLTYGALDRQARAIAARLQSMGVAGDRVLLLYPPGLEFISAFFACLYAGVIAVPAYPPPLNRPAPRIRAIVADSQTTLALSTSRMQAKLESRIGPASGLAALRWLATDDLALDQAEEWQEPVLSSDTLAFLQYTSGSTASPRGVMVSHGNLLDNERTVERVFEHSEETTSVGWLPFYHDMGLIGHTLQPMYIGARCVFMSPASFLQKPFRWLRAISHYKARTSGGPNFAYDLCTHKITADQRETLDLSTWDIMYSGSEPIRHDVLERFATAFEPCGVRREAFYPCYGLAEATLFVSGGRKRAVPITLSVQKDALEQNRVIPASKANESSQTLVGCGHAWFDQRIVIVDPDTLISCPPGRIGEIWVAGPHVAQGYWNQPEESARTFQAFVADTGEGPFLRTGDLGFLKDEELFVTGRLKDLIIILGRNHYPQDIELTVEGSHPALRAGCGAAFSVEVSGEERLVIVQEVERQYRKQSPDEMIGAVRQSVTEEHGLQAYAIVLIKHGSIPKTSSGKIQRHGCRRGFLEGSLNVLAEWRAAQPASSPDRFQSVSLEESPGSSADASRTSQTVEAIEAWLVAKLSLHTGIAAPQIDRRQPFTQFGLDSAKAITLMGELEEWLGRRLSPILIWNYPSIERLAKHLGEESGFAELSPRAGKEEGRV